MTTVRRAAPDAQELIRSARAVIAKAKREDLSTVAAAVRGASGKIYAGVNLESCHGPCAEPVALGAAFAQGETKIVGCVAVDRRGKILPPCGTCRQILHRHAPGAWIVLGSASRPRLVRVAALLPSPYVEDPRRT